MSFFLDGKEGFRLGVIDIICNILYLNIYIISNMTDVVWLFCIASLTYKYTEKQSC